MAYTEKLTWTNIPIDSLPEDIALKYVEGHALLEQAKAALAVALAKPGFSVKVSTRDASQVAIAYAKAYGNGKTVMTLEEFQRQQGISGRAS